jgi:hypothetical protein
MIYFKMDKKNGEAILEELKKKGRAEVRFHYLVIIS